MPEFVRRSEMPVARERLFEYHARPGALQRLLPPFQAAAVLETGGITDGERVVLRMGPAVVGPRWVALHRDYREGHGFTDEQESGPFARWVHRHLCLDLEGAPDRSVLEDRIDYQLPLGWLGQTFGGGIARGVLDRMFRFRHERTQEDLLQVARYGSPPMRVAITGATGLVGRSLEAFLGIAGHRVTRIVRRPRPDSDDIGWDPAKGELDAAKLEGVDAVVHLAGESIASFRWSPEKKHAIHESRIASTRLLAERIAEMASPPATLISASATGYYGDRPGDELDEKASRGQGFLADVCRDWEAATYPLATGSTRVVHLRIGVVLAAAGGALATQLPLFRLGLGGPVGNGRQGLSWIGLDDLVYAIHFLLGRSDIEGPVNGTAPGNVSNGEFGKTLGRVLRRPALLPAPAFALRLVLGEMADEMLLSGVRARPAVLEEAGFHFARPDLESALAFELGRAPGGIGA